MSVANVAFWASDYAYEIMGTRKYSYPEDVLGQKTDSFFGDGENIGFKPRVIDEYITTFQGLPIPQTEERVNSPRLLGEKNKVDGGQHSEEEQKAIDALKARDREVRAHEQAHIAAGGAYVMGGATFTYQSGPDGQQYAVGGEVKIDASPVKGDPEATIRKMQAIMAAAMAPVNPSDTDRAVAAAAARAQSSARSEIAEKGKQDNEEFMRQARERIKSRNSHNTDNTEKEQNLVNSAISAYTTGNLQFATTIDFRV